MKFLCYRGKGYLRGLGYDYIGKCDGTILHTSDLANLGNELSLYAEYDGDEKGFIISGNIKKQNVKNSNISNPKGLPKRVLEELALIIKNKSHREVLVE